MALRIKCPACKAAQTFDDEKRGRKVRCTECEAVIPLPAADADASQSKRKVKARAAEADEDAAAGDDEDVELPVKKKKKKGKKSDSGMGLILAGGGALVVLLLVGIGVGVYAFVGARTPNKAPAGPVAQAKDKEKKDEPIPDQKPPQGVPIVPGIKEGNPAKKGGAGIVNNVRGQGYRTERRNELRQIGLAFIDFCDTFKGANRTQENFLQQIGTFGPIRDAIKEGYYVLNLRADPSSGQSIVAYERDEDQGRHLCVRGDGSVDYVPVSTLKGLLGK